LINPNAPVRRDAVCLALYLARAADEREGLRVGRAAQGKVLIVGSSVRPSAAWVLPAEPSAVSQLRRQAVEFASRGGASDDVTQAIALAVSETVTNAVVHAYDGDDGGQVRVSCHVDGERFIVEVVDEGVGLGQPRDSSGVGHGLAMVGALAQRLEIGPGPGPARRGTAVTMAFGPVPAPSAPSGLEMLCALALETVADASCVDLVHEGVLRRIAAEVADDPTLTTWLRAAVPPAKPGTATWLALREGSARLIVHDPSVARSPGGTGERLDLTWWVAVLLEESDGTPVALWGLGGRGGGHAIPPQEVIDILADAGCGDLAQPAGRAVLSGRLSIACG
jgi:anti-sigma regulatory factor (Ser/Thr protein kinase)